MALVLDIGNYKYVGVSHPVESDPIKLVYYRYSDDVSRNHPRWWLNWLTSKLTKSEYIHVEIVFSDYYIYGIRMGEPVQKVLDKNYNTSRRYHCQEIPTNKEQSACIRNFLEDCLRKPSSFNYWGFYMLPIFPRSGAKENKWFCSELVVTALSYGGINFDEPPHTISPGKLFKLVNQKAGYIAPMVHSERQPLIL